MTVLDFAQHVVTICLRHNGSVVSWIRSVERNSKVGGHVDSFHLCGLAADVAFDDRDDMDLAILLANRLGLAWKPNGPLAVHFQALHPRKP